ASETAAGVASRSSARSFSRTGPGEEKSTASTAVRIRNPDVSRGGRASFDSAMAAEAGASASLMDGSLCVIIAYLLGRERHVRARRVDLGEGPDLERPHDSEPDQLQTREERRHGLGPVPHLAEKLEQRHRTRGVQPL